jgi:hypothetical protein
MKLKLGSRVGLAAWVGESNQDSPARRKAA